MIIVKLVGGLGNQMFQCALGLRLAIKFSEPLYFDLIHYKHQGSRTFELDVFGFRSAEVSATTKFLIKLTNKFRQKDKSIYCEKSLARDESVFKTPHPVYLTGFFQSYWYFEDIKLEIKERFRFTKPLGEANESIASVIKELDFVSIHIRRGDYIYWNNLDASHVLCGMDYYEKALGLIRQKVKDCKIFVFTDDAEWVKTNLAFEYTLIEGNTGKNSWKDMYLMSLCKRNIIANSTFSWWAAWLNSFDEKIVVAPKKWYGNKTNEEFRELCPPEWLRI